MPPRLVDVVRSVHPSMELPDALEPVLSAIVARAAAAWPSVRVDSERFVRAIAERVPADRPFVDAVAALQTDDLYLVCGCAAGEPGALAGFEALYGAVIERAVAAIGVSDHDRADLGQIVRERLLVSAPGESPRIATFMASGSLAAWVRVVSIRETFRLLPRVGAARREAPTRDEELADLTAPDDDPEIGYLKRQYRHEFKQAFQAAVAALDARARLLLRQHTLDGLSIDQLAALHGVHRATAARQVQAARNAVLSGTRRELRRRLQLSPDELASMMRLIQSKLDVSLSRVLRT
jgi:RNA polymerase sigma-70 factor (ECF subfamily)